ncbi:MAG: GAF domain-containing protein, partial [Dehalococcoidia bacterium]
MKSPRQRRTPPRLPSARVEAEREAAVQAFIERQIEQRRRLSELAVGISAEAALEGLLEKVPRIAKEVIGAEMAALVFLEEGGMGVEHFSYSVPDRSLFPDHPPEGKGLLGFVFQESQAVRVENVTQHPHYGGLFKDMPHPPMKAFLGVPLRAEDGATLGAVYVANGSMGPAFSEQDQELLTVLGEYISTALERIRQQKRLQASEAKARALERRYRTLLEKANDAVFISRARDGRFVEVNRRAVELTGYSAEELLKMKVWDLRSKEHHSLLRQRLAKIVEKGSGSAVYDDLPLLRKNGTKLEVLVSTTLAEVEGELLFEAIVRDVTQERQYQRELEKLYGETVEQQRLTAALNRISQTLNSTLDYRQVLATICWDCLELMQISGVYIWVVEGEEIVLKVVHLADREGLERGEIRRPLREDSRVIASRVAATGKAEIVNNVPE